MCDLALLKSVDLYPHEEHVYTEDIKTEDEASVGASAVVSSGAGERAASRRVERFFFGTVGSVGSVFTCTMSTLGTYFNFDN